MNTIILPHSGYDWTGHWIKLKNRGTPDMFCLDTYLRESEDYEIHMTRSGFKDCARFIEENAPEVVHVKPGEKIVGARIIGIPPVPIGINEEKGTIMLP